MTWSLNFTWVFCEIEHIHAFVKLPLLLFFGVMHICYTILSCILRGCPSTSWEPDHGTYREESLSSPVKIRGCKLMIVYIHKIRCDLGPCFIKANILSFSFLYSFLHMWLCLLVFLQINSWLLRMVPVTPY